MPVTLDLGGVQKGSIKFNKTYTKVLTFAEMAFIKKLRLNGMTSLVFYELIIVLHYAC